MSAAPSQPEPKGSVGLCNDFPLRPDFFAQFVLPRDMTQREARRVCAFIMALAIPDDADAERTASTPSEEP